MLRPDHVEIVALALEQLLFRTSWNSLMLGTAIKGQDVLSPIDILYIYIHICIEIYIHNDHVYILYNRYYVYDIIV